MFIYTYYPKGAAPSFSGYLNAKNAVFAVISTIESQVAYEKRRVASGSPEFKSLQEIDAFMKIAASDPSIENGQKLIHMFETERTTREDYSVLHELKEVPVIQSY